MTLRLFILFFMFRMSCQPRVQPKCRALPRQGLHHLGLKLSTTPGLPLQPRAAHSASLRTDIRRCACAWQVQRMTIGSELSQPIALPCSAPLNSANYGSSEDFGTMHMLNITVESMQRGALHDATCWHLPNAAGRTQQWRAGQPKHDANDCQDTPHVSAEWRT